MHVLHAGWLRRGQRVDVVPAAAGSVPRPLPGGESCAGAVRCHDAASSTGGLLSPLSCRHFCCEVHAAHVWCWQIRLLPCNRACRGWACGQVTSLQAACLANRGSFCTGRRRCEHCGSPHVQQQGAGGRGAGGGSFRPAHIFRRAAVPPSRPYQPLASRWAISKR